MKPVDRPLYYDLYIVVHKSATGYFSLAGPGANINGTLLGLGVYATLDEAQKEQTVQLLKGNHVEIFHLEYPI